VTPEELADSIAVCVLDTATVLTAKLALDRPTGTVT